MELKTSIFKWLRYSRNTKESISTYEHHLLSNVSVFNTATSRYFYTNKLLVVYLPSPFLLRISMHVASLAQ